MYSIRRTIHIYNPCTEVFHDEKFLGVALNSSYNLRLPVAFTPSYKVD